MQKIYLTLIVLACLISVKSFCQCATPTTVPHNESFNFITSMNQLPGCVAISDPSTCVTFTSGGRIGQGCAGFIDTQAQTSYFYSRAIQLYAGITYSVSAWYKNSSSSGNTWTDFSIHLGASQSSVGLSTLASSGASYNGGIYVPVTNTFVVANSGVYYFAVSGTSTGGFGFTALIWDDLDVIIPCSIGGNAPNVTVVASSSVLCAGQSNFTATASGADTYLWYDGTTGPILTNPNITQNALISVVGTNTLTACSMTTSLYQTIMQAPNIIVIGSKPAICAGENIVLSANGAPSYSWSTEATSAVITVTPGSSTTYTVIGTSAAGCTASAEYSVIVNPVPVISYTASAATPTVCKGEPISFEAEGAVSYQWFTNQGIFSGSSFNLAASSTTTVNLFGTGANGCVAKAVYILKVEACTGIKTDYVPEFKIYPNPGKGKYTLDCGNEDLKTIAVTDFTGKIIYLVETIDSRLSIDISSYAKGLYYANIRLQDKTFSIKLVKE